MENQKLSIKDIKAGDKIIIVSNHHDISAIIIVNCVGFDCVQTVNNVFAVEDYNYYKCPNGLQLIPNMTTDNLKMPAIVIGSYLPSKKFLVHNRYDDRCIDCYEAPNEQVYEIGSKDDTIELTVADIEKKYGKKVKIIKEN